MTEYKVGGMSCSACVRHVEKAVTSLPGVDEVNVSLLTNEMKVEGDISPKEVIKAVKKAGYSAKEIKKSTGNNTSVLSEGDDSTTDADEPNETKKLFQRFLTSLVFLLMLMYFSMGHTMLGLPIPSVISNPISLGVIEMTLSLIVLYINRIFFIRGFKSVLHLSTNMDTLVALGSTASFLYSFVSLLIIADMSWRGHTNMAMNFAHTHYYFESAAMIPTLITIGKTLESYSKGRTTDALNALKKLAPDFAHIERNGAEIKVPLKDVQVNDILIVRPGERIPVDGIIIEGETSIDESSLTGESIPVDVKVGSEVKSSTTSLSGFIKVKATKVGDDTTLSKIIKLVSDASASKAPIARIADKISGIFVPTVIVISIITFIGWLIAGAPFTSAFSRSISVLVISCPCALGLATPVAIMVGNGLGARNGILFKNATALENTGRVTTVVFDKTGTITHGEPEVTDIITNISNTQFMEIASSLEKKSAHPLAKAISKYCETNYEQAHELEVSEFTNVSGNGVSGIIDGVRYFAGKMDYIQNEIHEDSIATETLMDQADKLKTAGKTVTYFATESKLLGIIAFSDTIKSDSADAIEALKEHGIKVAMLTGDNQETADSIAKKCGIDTVFANVLPDEKEALIRELRKTGVVAMVGDGINDAPSLTSADIGIAIGAGSDIAIDSADIVLEKNSLLDVSKAIQISKSTLINIKENLFWAFFYNIICIPLAIGLYQVIFHLNFEMKPMIGALAMSLSSVTVCLNALRLNLKRI